MENQMSRQYSICKATINDINIILEINSFYLDRINKSQGFLILKRNFEYVKSKLENYRVLIENGKVLGYIEIEHATLGKFLQLEWFDIEYHKFIKSHNDFMYIEQIAVNNEYVGRGAGKFLVDNIINEYTEYPFLSSIITKPYRNNASIEFHTKCGFRQVALENFIYESHDYESLLFQRYPQIMFEKGTKSISINTVK
jgi:N-acetylglutamate synthase-like GNAT family acetyltransferase